MALTNRQLWERYNRLKDFRRLEIKRRLAEIEVFPTELVTNGSFTTDTDWTKGTNWSIGGGTANANAVTDTSLSQDIGAGAGFLYQVTFLISEYASGSLDIAIGD